MQRAQAAHIDAVQVEQGQAGREGGQAGDFNDWEVRLHQPMALLGLRTFEDIRLPTFPARLPLLNLDRIYVRGLRPLHAQVPHGRAWRRMSDHLPLIAELAWE